MNNNPHPGAAGQGKNADLYHYAHVNATALAFQDDYGARKTSKLTYSQQSKTNDAGLSDRPGHLANLSMSTPAKEFSSVAMTTSVEDEFLNPSSAKHPSQQLSKSFNAGDQDPSDQKQGTPGRHPRNQYSFIQRGNMSIKSARN